MKTLALWFLLPIMCAAFIPWPSLAQDSSRVLTTQRSDRSGDGPVQGPNVTASVTRLDGDVYRILVAANDVDGDSDIPCDFYVNNHFFAGQAGPPHGIFVGTDVARVPFTFAVWCRDAWGNATKLAAAVTNRDVQEAYSCTFEGQDVSATKDDVTASQVGDSGLTLAYETENEEIEGQNVSVSASISTSGEQATATVIVVRNGVNTTIGMKGEVSLGDDERTITGFDLSNSTSGETFSCS